MTVDELVRRVYQRRHSLMVADGSMQGFEVILSPDDWADVVTEERDPNDPKITFEVATGFHRVIGIPMRMDPGLEHGEVRLRGEVVA